MRDQAKLTLIKSPPPVTGEDVLDAMRPILADMLPRVSPDDPYHAALHAFASAAGIKERWR